MTVFLSPHHAFRTAERLSDVLRLDVLRLTDQERASEAKKRYASTRESSKSPNEIFFAAQRILAFKRRRPPKRD
jgi:hypothetical protein